jgi:RND family efflux transporter MFP subunit
MIHEKSCLKPVGFLLGSVAVICLAGCGAEEVKEEAPVARPVKTLVVGGGAAGPRSYPASVAASNQVDLSFRVGGPLTELPVKEGDQVRKGQLIARIDPRDFQISLESAKAKYEKADADFRRYTALYEKDAVSAAQLDQSRAARDMAKAAVEDAEADLADTHLRAPFAARVGKTFVENFQDVRAKEPILSLVDVGNVEVRVDVAEAVVARARRADWGRITARFDTAPGREFDLELKETATQADPRTQTYRVTFLMPQPEGVNILPGMTATVVHYPAAPAGESGAIVIPAAAVFANEAGESHVWVVDEAAKTVHRRRVTTGELTGTGEIRILDGLEAGETIAVSAISQLREAMEIRPVEEVRDL